MAGYIGTKAAVSTPGSERKFVFDISTTTTSITGVTYTPNHVHVFHNGIRLVDGTDYTATNGNSITLTNAAQSGDQVVVVSYATYQNADMYTKTEADSRYVNATGDTMTGALRFDTGTNGISATNSSGLTSRVLVGHQSDTVYMGAIDGNFAGGVIIRANASDSLVIDNSGRVTLPYQPSFRAHSFVPISSSTGVIVWQTAAHNVGNHYNTSNGTFTAPVNGTYHFAGNILMTANSSTSYIRVLFRINGSPSTNFTDSLTGGAAGAFTNYSYHSIQIAQSFYLYAGDTVQMWNDNPSGSTYHTTGYGSFSGFLVG